MSGLSRETRVQIMLSEDELAAIDDWRFKHRMPSRAAAIRKLLNVGLRAVTSPAKLSTMSKDIGLFSDERDDNNGA